MTQDLFLSFMHALLDTAYLHRTWPWLGRKGTQVQNRDDTTVYTLSSANHAE